MKNKKQIVIVVLVVVCFLLCLLFSAVGFIIISKDNNDTEKDTKHHKEEDIDDPLDETEDDSIDGETDSEDSNNTDETEDDSTVSEEEIDNGLADARNAVRFNDVASILSAVSMYLLDTSTYPDEIENMLNCSDGVVFIGTGEGNVDLSFLVDGYMVEIPKDPSDGTVENIGYTICIADKDRIRLQAPYSENDNAIMVER